MASNAPTRSRVEINPNFIQAHAPELTAIHDKVLSQLDVMDDKLPAPLLWQEVVRQVMDSEPIDVVVSGSSAELRALLEAMQEPGAREARAIVISLDRRAPRQWRFQMQRPARCTWASTSASS